MNLIPKIVGIFITSSIEEKTKASRHSIFCGVLLSLIAANANIIIEFDFDVSFHGLVSFSVVGVLFHTHSLHEHV